MKNFTQASNPILKENQLSVPARYLYLVLREHCKVDNYCFPSQETLGRILGFTPRYIQDLLNELYDSRMVKKFSGGLGRTNIYYVEKNLILKSNENNSSYVTGTLLPTQWRNIVPPNDIKERKKGNYKKKFLEKKNELVHKLTNK